MRLRFAAVVALLSLVAACQTTAPADYVQFHAGLDEATVAGHITDKIRACWFDGKRKAFDGYSYAPENGMSSSRILIVPREEPHGLPVLIVEARKAKRGTDVRLYGPLMQTGEADAIRNDIKRWTGGARDC